VPCLIQPGDRVLLTSTGRGILPPIHRLPEIQRDAITYPIRVVRVEDMGHGIWAVDVDGPLSEYCFTDDCFSRLPSP
jgi:hypothetical protein